MEIKKLKNDYQFVNESAWNRSGFYHKSILFKGTRQIAENKVQYCNRTWECYQFQTSMRGCIYNYIEKELKQYIQRFKARNDIARLTKTKKEEVTKQFEEQEEIKELRELYAELL